MRCASRSSIGTSPGSDQRLTRRSSTGAATSPTSCGTRRASCSARGRSRWPSPRASRRWPSAGSRSPPGRRRPSAPPAQLDDLDLSGYAGAPARLRLERLLRLVPGDGQGRPAPPRRLRDGERARAWRSRAPTALAAILRLLHPIVPFVTEEIWGRLHALDPALDRRRAAAHQRAVAARPARDDRGRRGGDGRPRSSWSAASATCAPSPACRPAAWLPLTVVPADAAAARGHRATGSTTSRPLARVRPDRAARARRRPRPPDAGRLDRRRGGLARRGGAARRRPTPLRGSRREAHLRRGIERLAGPAGRRASRARAGRRWSARTGALESCARTPTSRRQLRLT